MGDRALVIYPAVADRAGSALRNIEKQRGKWDKLFPGVVRVITGDQTAEQKDRAIADLSTGVAKIGICTIVVEVGINIPRLRRVIVVHPERFGLTGLHQMRGRLAREGGSADFDLLLTDDVAGDSMTRLHVLETTTDGALIAEADLQLRGAGELHGAGKQQSGASLSMLPGRDLNSQHLIDMDRVLATWASNDATARKQNE